MSFQSENANRCTMHKTNADYPEGERRLMHRVIVAGTMPI